MEAVLDRLRRLMQQLSVMFVILIITTVAMAASFLRAIGRTEAAANAGRDAAVAARDAVQQSDENEQLIRDVRQVLANQQADQEARAAQQARQGPLFVAYMRCLFSAGERALGFTPEFEQELAACDRTLIANGGTPRN